MTDPARRALGVGAALLLAVACVWPFWGELGLRPVETDDVLWVFRGALDQPHWLRWILGRSHFVGYRPLPAASFSLDWVLSGGTFRAPVFHATDLALHALACLLVYPLYRALFPELPRWGGLLAAAVFAAHPVAAEVVPWFSRRSYVMGTAASLLALQSGRRGRVRAATGWIAAALLCNEAAFLVVPVLLLVVGEAHGRAGLRRVWPVPLVAIAIFAVRFAIVGRLGGYHFDDRGPERILGVAEEALVYLWTPTHTPRAATDTTLLAAAAIALIYLLRGIRTPGGRAMWAWIGGSWILVAATQTWFFRLAYPMAAPLALLVGAVAASTRPGILWLPQILLVGWIGWQSPVFRGVPEAERANRVEADGRLAELEATLGRVRGKADVLLVSPNFRRKDANPWWNGGDRWNGRSLRVWGNFVTRNTRVEVRQLALMRVRPPGSPEPAIATDPEPTVVFPKGSDLFLWPERRDDRRKLKEELRIPLSEMEVKKGRAAYLYFVPPIAGGLVRLDTR